MYILTYSSSVIALLDSLLLHAVALMSVAQPCQGPFVFTCAASQVSPQMRVTIQSPTESRPVEHTAAYLDRSDSYDVMLEGVSSASEPNIAVRLTVTIRNVSNHVGTRYRCVQHHNDGTIHSEELVIKSELISFLIINCMGQYRIIH